MRFLATRIFVTSLTLGSAAHAQISGPFYLTIIPEDGTTSYPATVATVSRGAQILSSALDYVQEFIFDSDSGRIFKADAPTNGNGPLTEDLPLLFNNPGGTDSALEQVTVDGAVYLVKAGAGSEEVYVWSSIPTTTGLPVQVNWEGVDSTNANAAIRIDVEAP